MKTYNIKKRISKQARQAIENAIDTHEKYKKAYFWRAPANAAGRRAMESNFEGVDFALETKKGLVEVSFSFSCSCKNVYYSMSVYVDGVKKDVRVLTKLLKK